MALSVDETKVFTELADELGRAVSKLDRADRYYDGAQVLEQLGLAIPEDLLRFTVCVNYPRWGVDGIHERQSVKGLKFAGDESSNQELWDLWKANDLPSQSRLGFLDTLVYGRSFLCVGADDDLGARITVESPRNMIVQRDMRTGKVSAALRLYGFSTLGQPTHATLYLPNETIWMVKDGRWLVEDRDEHGVGEVGVFPMYNRRRLMVPPHRTLQGVSEMEDLIDITDSAARNLTNAQVAQETHAVPQRGVLGATKGDFVGEDGKPLTTWEAYFGAVWALGNKDAKTFQFDATNMENFVRMDTLYAQKAAAAAAAPPNEFGLPADDAASADAIRSRETRRNRRIESKNEELSSSIRDAFRYALRVRDGVWSPDAARIETLWTDPSTPTKAQEADRAVKLYQARILPLEATWEELGYGPEKIARLKEMQEREQNGSYAAIMQNLTDEGALDGAVDPSGAPVA